MQSDYLLTSKYYAFHLCKGLTRAFFASLENLFSSRSVFDVARVYINVCYHFYFLLEFHLDQLIFGGLEIYFVYIFYCRLLLDLSG